MMEFIKYPRTNHIEGARFTCNPLDLKKIKLESVAGKHLVIEEKMDGTQVGIFFERQDFPRIQSRGHFIDEVYNPEFDLLKNWLATHRESLWEVLGDRYILFGEWLFAKHTLYYDQLPDFLLEYDIYDRELGAFLNTSRRQELLKDLGFLSSVRVVGQGMYSTAYELYRLTGDSNFVSSNQKENFLKSVSQKNLDPDIATKQTDLSGKMEGLYIKHEHNGIVKSRYKFIRAEFLARIIELQEHWRDRAMIRNLILGYS